ncbi:Palmitoylated plasma membrane-bound casein kinase [Fusarium torreyae]|uniref:non-specific serine/threonine protein kinase n=1 Tax=Fusarium torreyae TaxID=1237075 RepID=A0A9W8S720_9HYPO|nr:Palmitoylated plasma membrane-bound casein kinase [Fusarium torreyae]
MDLLGPSLETLFQKFKYLFTVETVAMLGQQMISRLNAAHKKGMIHRDVKPDNFVVAENRVFLIDLAMMKPYQDPRTKQHIPYEENIPVVGTARYMSINTHLGRTQSRRDDFESLWHVLLYFLRGHLPWEGIKADSLKDKNDMILKRKKVAEAEDLCEGFPHEFCELGHYVRNLGFEQNPDCDYMQKLLGQVSTDDMEGRGTIPGYFEKVSNRNGPAPLCSPEVAGSKVVLGKETNRARERSSREEVLQVIQSQPLTWLEELTTWAQIETIRGQDVAYNKQQQETLNNIFQTVSSSVYWLTKSQKTVFTPQYGLSRMRMSRMAERERTPLSKELESVCHVSKKVSTDILREGYSDNVSRLKDLLGTIKNLAELELEHSSCMKEKQVVIRSIGANNQVYHRPDDEETLRQQELAAKRDEVERATTSLGKQSGTQQGPRVAQKHKLTLSPSQQPCKRRSQEKLNTTADV